MEVPLCHIDIVQDGEIIIARINTEMGNKKIINNSLEGLLEELYTELEDEFDGLI